jgi:hypothetical protein
MTDVIDVEQVAQLPAIANPTPSHLLQMAVQQGADLDKLERLMALQERWEATEARKAYDTAFAAFKAEAVVIVKNRRVTAGPLAGKSYAELFSVVNAITPALSRHGLSSSWKITKDEPQWLEVTCTIKHVAGHTESVSMGGPPDVGGAKNAIQARASTVSYLERYTLKAITGLSEQDDDDNGGRGGAPDPEDSDEDYKLIQAGRDKSMQGMAALTGWYNTLTAAQKKVVNKEFTQMRGVARTADQGGAA